MKLIAPLENVESVAAATLLPLMYAESDVPTASISRLYQVAVL